MSCQEGSWMSLGDACLGRAFNPMIVVLDQVASKASAGGGTVHNS